MNLIPLQLDRDTGSIVAQSIAGGGGGSGTVTSVAATGSPGLTVGGSPITSSGTLTFTLNTELQGLSSLATTGFVQRTGPGTYTVANLTSPQIVTALGFSPYNSSNPAGYISAITSVMVTTALGYVPYPTLSNPNNYLTAATGVTTASAGSGITINGGAGPSSGAITIANTGILTFNGRTQSGNITLNQTDVTNAAPNVSLFTNDAGYITTITHAAVITAIGYTPVNKAGDSMTGTLTMDNVHTVTNLPTPVLASDAATKGYVDAAIAGLSWKETAQAATTTDLGSVTYNNGAFGFGATLTNAGAQSALVLDSYAVQSGDRVLVKNQATSTQNGIYTVTTVGSGSTNWVLTRTTDADSGTELDGAAVYVDQGTVNANTGWTQTTTGTIVVGTTNLSFAQFSGSTSYTAGTGLNLLGNQFNNTGVLSVTASGAGISAAPTTGNVVVMNTGVTSVIAGSGILVNGGAGPVSGAVTISSTASGGTVTTVSVVTANGVSGSVTNPTTTPAITLTLGAITPSSVAATGTLGGSNFSGSSSGTNTGDQTITLTGDVTGSGTGSFATTLATVNGNVGSFTSANITVDAKGRITAASSGAVGGSVTSVALSDGSTSPIYTISGSPVTTSGTLTFTLATQTKNTVLAGPASGADAQPTFRALVAADIPTNGVERVVWQYTNGQFTSGTPTSTTSGVSVTASTPSTSTATYSFTGYDHPPVSIATYGQQTNTPTLGQTQWQVLMGLVTTVTPYTMADTGTNAAPNLLTSFTSSNTITLTTSAADTNATGSGVSYLIIEFKF